MKNLLFALLAMLFVACSSEPKVTSCLEATSASSGDVSFRGTKKVSHGWVHYDSNKSCPNQSGYCFRVLKSTPSKILKSDRCDHCGYTWSLHK